MSLKVAYLINQYPKVSHSFIRREILALEACGIPVSRFSIRSCAAELVDEADKQELEKTRFVLGSGIKGLLSGLLRVAVTRPIRFLQSLRLTFKIGWQSEQGVARHLAYFAEACVLLGWFAEEGITHIHSHFGTNSTTVALLCHTLGGPAYSFTVHGPEEFDKVKAIALPEKIRRSAFVVAISSFGKSQLYRWCDFNQWSKIHVVHCGVDQDFLIQLPTAIPDDPQFVCVGRLCEDKGQVLLIDAAQRLASEGLRFKLILVGDGSLRAEIEALIAALNLENCVEITGWASSTEVRQRLLTSRVMVLPSFAEGLPVVIMEALALHRPVISTTIAGIPELVRPGISGWLVPPGDIDALTNAMRSALQSPISELERMGQQGADQVAQQHNSAIESGKLAALFRSTGQRLPDETTESKTIHFANVSPAEGN
ncbi:MAG: glycosyltransferase family 4 protein [Cyanobacteria bacterium CRU_2_1]|nr:glycosyltransferase family 4 protein [Cyanobacteria bacterium RU_5_0]NJR58867.1 glycosyltransferase family 4 protein [Cyanobacteria bacterium CRU_2_1]